MLSGVANATPKSDDGEVEMIRMLKGTKDSAVKACTQAICWQPAKLGRIASGEIRSKFKVWSALSELHFTDIRSLAIYVRIWVVVCCNSTTSIFVFSCAIAMKN